MEWKDITSYSKGDKNREIRSVVAVLGELKLVVTRHINYEKNQWLATCLPFFDLIVVGDGSLEDAKTAAIERLYEDICDVTDAMDR